MTKKYTYPLGIIIIVIGSLLLFQNIGLKIGSIDIAWNDIAKRLWPIVLLIIGLKRIGAKRGFMTSYFLVILGIFFMLRSIATLHPALNALRNYSWSLFVIITGLILILRPSPSEPDQDDFISTKRQSKTHTYDNRHADDGAKIKNYNYSDPYFSDQSTAFFEDFENENDAQNGTWESAVSERSYQASLRSTSISLAESDFKPGLNKIELLCSMGEINLTLPKSINITIVGESSFGEIVFAQKKYSGLRRISKISHSPAQYSEIDVQINATIKFGEITIDLQ